MSSLIPLRIRLPYQTDDEFIDRYGVNVARGGIFIATKATKPEGTPVAFEFVLADGKRILRGEGVVQKTQAQPERGRVGMTLRFTRLDGPSRELLDRLLARREGPSDDAPPAAVEPSPTPRRTVEIPTPSAPPSAADLVLGLDLGTTHCRAAMFVDGRPQLISVGEHTSIPSVVGMDDQGNFLVGTRAKAQVISNPGQTAFGFKRLMGLRARSRKASELASRFPFPLLSDAQGDAAVELGARLVPLPQLASVLLTELKNAAQAAVGRPVHKAVLCVPAYFNGHQRAAMLQAGELAGLEVLALLNEPSAAALAFGYGRGLARKRLLVYDLGGGTFDASVVELTGDDLEVVTTGGDSFLGGLDFDHRLADRLSKTLPPSVLAQLERTSMSHQRIRDAAELAKISLSDLEAMPIFVPCLATGSDDQPIDLNVELTRSQLEEMTSDLVERTLDITRAVLEVAHIQPQGLDEVLLVGGQSRAPLVQRRVEGFLGRPVRTDVDPHAAVAYGAAILGHSLLQRDRGKAGVTLSEVLSVPIGIGLKGGAMRRVLERNTRLPAQKSISVPVRAGETVGIAVYQGLSSVAEENEYLGSLRATADRQGELSLHFSVTQDGRLELSASTPTGRKVETTVSTLDAADEVRAALFAQAPLPGDEAAPSGLFQGLRRLFAPRR